MKIISAAIVATFLSSGAYAADAVMPVPMDMAAFTFTGPYIGAHAGWGWGKTDADNLDVLGISDRWFAHFDSDGFVGGLHAGDNYQFSNNFVLGLEGDIDYSDISQSETFDVFGDDVTAEAKLRWKGSVRARAGYAIDRFMPYVTGGVAFGSYKLSVSDDLGFVDESDTQTHTGWTVGGGAEYAFTDNMIGRLEYRYTDYGSKGFSAAGDFVNFDANLKTNEVIIGVSYKF